jgi:hypothetical protein
MNFKSQWLHDLCMRNDLWMNNGLPRFKNSPEWQRGHLLFRMLYNLLPFGTIGIENIMIALQR